MYPFREEIIQCSFWFTFKPCVGNYRTSSWTVPSIVVNPLTVIQQNKNPNLERMKEDSKTLRLGLVLSNARSLRVVCLLTTLASLQKEREHPPQHSRFWWAWLCCRNSCLFTNCKGNRRQHSCYPVWLCSH